MGKWILGYPMGKWLISLEKLILYFLLHFTIISIFQIHNELDQEFVEDKHAAIKPDSGSQ